MKSHILVKKESCTKCKRYPQKKDGLCVECYKYAVWRGNVGPGKNLKDIISKINKESTYGILPIS